MKFTELEDGVFTLKDVLSAVECKTLIRDSEQAGYETATITTNRGAAVDSSIRNNARRIEDDPQRATDLWRRLCLELPPFVRGQQAIGVNERFRFYRYDPGERFAGHVDAPFRRSNGEQSLLTLMVYLNDDFEGGETTFRELVVRPKTGSALLFRHEIFHEGTVVRRGRKYVLRSDVMFSPPGRLSQA